MKFKMVKSDHCSMLVKIIVIFLVAFPSVVYSLFEDQVGKWDWRRRYIGRVESVINFHQSTQSSIIVSTNQNVISSLSVLNGSIHWRQVFEEKTPTMGSVNLITSHDIYGGITEAVSDPVVVSISDNGRFVRKWSSLTGLLLKETSLPVSLVDGVQDGSHQLLFNVDVTSNIISVAKMTPLSVDILHYDLNTGSLQKTVTTAVTGDWFNDGNDCSFVSSKHLVCIDGKNSSIKVLPIESTSFNSYPLSLFGLNNQGSAISMSIVTFDHQLNHPSPVFALNLGGKDGFVILKIIKNELKLVKILAKVSKLTIVPMNLPEEEFKDPKYGVFALIAKPDEVKTITKDSGKDVVPFKIAAFELDDWTELKKLNGHFTMRSPADIDTFQILPLLKPFNDLKLCKIMVTTTDERIMLISSEGMVHWTREESLSSIVTAHMVDLPLSELDSSIEQAFGPSANMITQFMSRISWQVTQVQLVMVNWMNELNELFAANLRSGSQSAQAELEYSTIEKDGLEGKTRDYFGLNKIIVTLTRTGKVFGLESSTGQIFWSFFDDDISDLDNQGISIHILRTSNHFPYPPLAVIVTKTGLLLSFNPITGEVIEKAWINEPLKQILLMSHFDDTHQKALILLTDSDKVHVYPKSSCSTFLEHKDKYYMSVGYPSTGIITGYRFDNVIKDGDLATNIWSLNIPVHEQCADCNPMTITFKRHNEHVHSLGRVLGDRNVLYKYLNPNVAVVVVEGSDTQATNPVTNAPMSAHLFDLHLVDAVSGRLLYSIQHKRSKGPVNVIHSENSVIYSYFNEKARRTEISALDLYEGFSQSNGTAFSSLDLRTPIVEHSTFIFPTGLRTMVDTVSEKGITNKHILIAISSGGLLELPKAFLDPRRPITPTAEHREEGLIPYMPELPVLSEGLINYNKLVQLVRGIEVSPAGLESTCLVFVYGLDTFYTRVTPSKTFDILKDDFDHLLIIGVLILLICLAYITKYFSQRKILKSAWL